MAFTDLDKVNIRTYLARAAIFHDLDVRLEAAITAIEGLTDNGQTEAYIKSLLGDLDDIETKIQDGVLGCMDTFEINKVKRDPRQKVFMLERRARQLVHRLAIALAVKPTADAFAPSELGEFGAHYYSGGTA